MQWKRKRNCNGNLIFGCTGFIQHINIARENLIGMIHSAPLPSESGCLTHEHIQTNQNRQHKHNKHTEGFFPSATELFPKRFRGASSLTQNHFEFNEYVISSAVWCAVYAFAFVCERGKRIFVYSLDHIKYLFQLYSSGYSADLHNTHIIPRSMGWSSRFVIFR